MIDYTNRLSDLLRGELDRVAWQYHERDVWPPSVRRRWKCGEYVTLYHNDGVRWLHTEPSELYSADLYFMDPPFNIGHDYNGYDDNLEPASHSALLRLMIKGMSRCASHRSVIAIHVPEPLLLTTMEHARDAGLFLWQHIVRHFRFGQYGETRYINGHENLLLYCTDSVSANFLPRRVLVEGQRRHMGKLTAEEVIERLRINPDADVRELLARMNEGTPDKRLKTAKWKGYVPPSTVWPIARIQGNNKERWKDHPNQLPFEYMARLVLAHTRKRKPKVVEVCAGSGPLAVVCEASGIEYHGCDISDRNLYSIELRVDTPEQLDLARAALKKVAAPSRLTLPKGRNWNETESTKDS